MGIAIEQGLFDQEFARDGIAVTSLRASASRDVRESHFDHRQPDSFRQGGSTPPIWSYAIHRDTRLIGLTWVDEYQAIIARLESGITEPRHLRNRRIGIARRVNDKIDFFAAMSLRGAHAALRLGGVDPGDVEFVDLPVQETYMGDSEESNSGQLWSGGHRARRQQVEPFALVRGTVDAIYVSGAAGLWMREFLGARDVVELGSHPDPEIRGSNQQPATLTVSAQLMADRPDLVERYVAQIAKAALWSQSNRAYAVQSFANEVGTSYEWADAAYGPRSHMLLVPSVQEPLVRGLVSHKNFLLEHGFIQQDFDVEQWICRDPLERGGWK
ncbi:dibenzothiophene desulfurization enzyme B [Piscinibacter sakaiensis]|uniref:Dibenzothiophene desulfurization enzyme B n=2 Tax=Piscinibacter sakaiensis TaxID=1547922 RepID=A0A0K8NUX5_PISS1|nr:dibenzothiophene desulfurization enzyme B [Piscinibacter sakaiensis]